MIKDFLIKIINYFCCIKYEIGFIEKDALPIRGGIVSNKIKWLNTKYNENSWFADPFILSVDGARIKVLVEEYFYSSNKGRISLLDIRADSQGYKLQRVTPVLSLDTHLSFPYIVEDGDDIYICPENFQSGMVNLYKFDKETYKLGQPICVVNEPLVDVQIIKHNDMYYLCGVKCETGAMEETKRLKVYKSRNLCTTFDFFYELQNSKCEERGAGKVFCAGDMIIRPAQCCEGGYGTMLIFYRMDISDNAIKEVEIGRLYPNLRSKNGLSLHTFNIVNDLCVVDGHDYKHVWRISRLIAPLIDKMLKLYRK